MESWFAAAILSLIIYGFWGFFPKIAVTYINPQSALIFEVAGALIVGLGALLYSGFHPQTHPRGILFAILTGVTGMLGTLFYFTAAGKGKISIVVSMTALYPLITIILAAVILREPITIKQLFGMAFALIALFLFAG